jgi:hypothetical protein
MVPYFEHDKGTVVDILDGLVGGAIAELLFCLVLQPLLWTSEAHIEAELIFLELERM